MDDRERAILESAGTEFAETLRHALTQAAALYELKTGSVITRVEALRLGVDWAVDARAADNVPSSL